eukprot:4098905-Prymnesium_polylepis.1
MAAWCQAVRTRVWRWPCAQASMTASPYSARRGWGSQRWGGGGGSGATGASRRRGCGRVGRWGRRQKRRGSPLGRRSPGGWPGG